jgi:hypothetical protein
MVAKNTVFSLTKYNLQCIHRSNYFFYNDKRGKYSSIKPIRDTRGLGKEADAYAGRVKSEESRRVPPALWEREV